MTTGRAGWDKVLEHYGVDYLLVDLNYHGDTGLLDQVERSGTWAVVYQTGDARLYVRRASGTGMESAAGRSISSGSDAG